MGMGPTLTNQTLLEFALRENDWQDAGKEGSWFIPTVEPWRGSLFFPVFQVLELLKCLLLGGSGSSCFPWVLRAAAYPSTNIYILCQRQPVSMSWGLDGFGTHALCGLLVYLPGSTCSLGIGTVTLQRRIATQWPNSCLARSRNHSWSCICNRKLFVQLYLLLLFFLGHLHDT